MGTDVLDEALRMLDSEGIEGTFMLDDGVLSYATGDGRVVSATLFMRRGRPTLLRAALAAPGRRVADVTAGLGADAFTLAAAGCQVTAFERSAVPWLLLRDALRRAAADPLTAAAAARIALVRGDARHILPCLLPFEVITVDPMFVPRKPFAGKRRAMEVFQDLAGPDDDAFELLEVALRAATRRVSVKRQVKAARLGERVPTGVITGRTVRFDIYAGTAPVHQEEEK